MKEFEKWFSKLDDEQLTRFTKQNRLVAKLSWKAALRWILTNRKLYYDIKDKKVVATDSDIIYEELEE